MDIKDFVKNFAAQFDETEENVYKEIVLIEERHMLCNKNFQS